MRRIPIAYLASYLLSLLGNSIAGIAFPLIVLQVTGSALGAGAVAAATAVPAVLSGLLMGVVIDRINRRTSSVVTDLVSAAAVAALPLIDMVSGLSLGWFILCGIVGSLGDVPGMTARDTLLPTVVRHGGIGAERLLGIRESLGAVAVLLGPALAGALMVAFDGSTVLWITAATSCAAALLTLLIPHRVGAIGAPAGAAGEPVQTAGAADAAVVGTAGGSAWAQLRDGWRALSRSRFLVTTTMLSVAAVTALAALQGLILPVHLTAVGQPGVLGFVLSAVGGGMLVGGAAYAAAGAKGRRRVWYLAGLLGTTVGFVVVAALGPLWSILAGAFVVGLASGLFGGVIGVLMIERVPEHMRGRILGTQNAVMTAAPPAGIVAAALLTEYASVDVAAVVVAGAWVIAAAVGLFARSTRHLEPVREPAAPAESTAVLGA